MAKGLEHKIELLQGLDNVMKLQQCSADLDLGLTVDGLGWFENENVFTTPFSWLRFSSEVIQT